MERLGANAKCAPPLRSEQERRRLVGEVAEGRVDTIGSDYSPSPPHMKLAPDFFSAWGGISSVQLTLRLLLTADLPPHAVARLVSDNVARRFRLPGKGGIRVGGDADLVLVDLSSVNPLAEGELLDRHRASPYLGRPLRGAVRRSVIRGACVFRDGRLPGDPAGRHLRPVVTQK